MHRVGLDGRSLSSVSPSCAGEGESRHSRADQPPRTLRFAVGARALDRLEPSHLDRGSSPRGGRPERPLHRFLQSKPFTSTTVSASITSKTIHESPRAPPFGRAAGRYQPAAHREARASVWGVFAPRVHRVCCTVCPEASRNDRSLRDLIPNLTIARAPLVTISVCTVYGGSPGSRTVVPSGMGGA